MILTFLIVALLFVLPSMSTRLHVVLESGCAKEPKVSSTSSSGCPRLPSLTAPVSRGDDAYEQEFHRRGHTVFPRNCVCLPRKAGLCKSHEPGCTDAIVSMSCSNWSAQCFFVPEAPSRSGLLRRRFCCILRVHIVRDVARFLIPTVIPRYIIPSISRTDSLMPEDLLLILKDPVFYRHDMDQFRQVCLVRHPISSILPVHGSNASGRPALRVMPDIRDFQLRSKFLQHRRHTRRTNGPCRRRSPATIWPACSPIVSVSVSGCSHLLQPICSVAYHLLMLHHVEWFVGHQCSHMDMLLTRPTVNDRGCERPCHDTTARLFRPQDACCG